MELDLSVVTIISTKTADIRIVDCVYKIYASPDVDPNCGYEVVCAGVVKELVKEARLPHTRITDHHWVGAFDNKI